jgi:predicted phosphodiesterase
MKLGVLADIHANMPALEASLAALRLAGADQLVAIGDLLGYGPHPRQVLHCLEREGIPCLLGSADARLAYDLPLGIRRGIGDRTLEWSRDQLGSRELRFLRSLSSRYRVELSSGRLVAFHGTPTNPDGQIDLEASARELMDLCNNHKARYLVAASRHIAFIRQVSDRVLADPGSVGLSLGGQPGADVLLISDQPQGAQFQFIKVPYDVQEVVFDLKAWDFPPSLIEVVQNGRAS